MKWLYQVIISTAIQTVDSVIQGGHSRDDKDRDIDSFSTHRFYYCEAINDREHTIHNGQFIVGVCIERVKHGSFPIMAAIYGIPLYAEGLFNRVAQD